jgi:hypothetical protein
MANVRFVHAMPGLAALNAIPDVSGRRANPCPERVAASLVWPHRTRPWDVAPATSSSSGPRSIGCGRWTSRRPVVGQNQIAWLEGGDRTGVAAPTR